MDTNRNQRSPNGAYEALELTRDIVKDTAGVYALRVKGDGLIDALINDGDIIILRRGVEVRDGDLVAVYVKPLDRTMIRRWFGYSETGVRLQPEDPTANPCIVPYDDVAVQGKVVAVIRSEQAMQQAAPEPPAAEPVQAEQAALFDTPRPAWNVPADRGQWQERAERKWKRHNAALGRE
jgi:hypothetical protein